MSREQGTPSFSLGTYQARACQITLFVLLFCNAFLALILCLAIVYAVVPFSFWRKRKTLHWRVATILTCVIGYGIMALALGAEWLLVELIPSTFGMMSSLASLAAGVVFLPLAAAGSLQTLRESRRTIH